MRVRMIEIPLNEILDTVAAAETYEYDNDILLSSFHSWAYPITRDEIKAYAKSISDRDDYSEEDGNDIIEILTTWNNKYNGILKNKNV